MITVWGRRNSVNVQKVMWTLGELGLAYERHDVGGSFGVDADYLEKNPNGVVPTICDGDLVLFESNACVRHLARNYGQGLLMPTTAAEIALADQWMDWQASTFTPAFFQIFINKIRLPADQSNPEQAIRGAKQTGQLLQQVNSRLEQVDYLSGGDFSVADVPLAAMLYRYFAMDIERPDLPAVARYFERISSRPAYQQHVMIPFGSNFDEWNEQEALNAGVQ